MAELQILSEHLGALLYKLSDRERNKILIQVARQLRKNQRQRISSQKNPDGTQYVPRKYRLDHQKQRIKKKMFNRIKNAKYLRLEKQPMGIAIGFNAQLSRIARVHQFGLRDRVERGGKEVTYARRELLGFTETEIKMIETELLNYLVL